MIVSPLFFGKSRHTDISIQDESDFGVCFSFAHKHAMRLSSQLRAICQEKVRDGNVKGKYFICRDSTLYVCNYYRTVDYVRRTRFAKKYPELYSWFSVFLPKPELATAVLTWKPNELGGTPSLQFSSSLFSDVECEEKRVLLAPLHSNDSKFLDEIIFAEY